MNTATYSYLANSSLVGQIAFASNGASAMTTVKTYDDLNRLLSVSNTPADARAYAYNAANHEPRLAPVATCRHLPKRRRAAALQNLRPFDICSTFFHPARQRFVFSGCKPPLV